jgi:hypothetical protein
VKQGYFIPIWLAWGYKRMADSSSPFDRISVHLKWILAISPELKFWVGYALLKMTSLLATWYKTIQIWALHIFEYVDKFNVL